ncbi:MAG: hypothetical protein IPH88_13710 [Bacteroidales bacterium]|nr:hypothetical protein [Bacteroidales bacterium]
MGLLYPKKSDELLFVSQYNFGLILLELLLLLLFIYSHFLKVMLRVFTNYILITKVSNWEMDWLSYRKRPYWGYSKAQAIIFLILGVIINTYPFVLTALWQSKIDTYRTVTSVILASISILYFFSVLGITFFGLFDFEKYSRAKWENL